MGFTRQVPRQPRTHVGELRDEQMQTDQLRTRRQGAGRQILLLPSPCSGPEPVPCHALITGMGQMPPCHPQSPH